MPRHLKSGRTAGQKAADTRQVRETVSGIVDAVETSGDAARREFSLRFDSWSPSSFRLSPSEIERCLSRLSLRELDDIRFAQAQVRRFAEAQRASITDVEVETLPGVVLGNKTMPVESVGSYVPGGKYPLVASAHMGVVTARWPASSA